MKERLIVLAIAMVTIAPVICLLLAYPFMLLWNYAMVQAVEVCNPITYWPAFWLMMFLTLFIKQPLFKYNKDE